MLLVDPEIYDETVKAFNKKAGSVQIVPVRGMKRVKSIPDGDLYEELVRQRDRQELVQQVVIWLAIVAIVCSAVVVSLYLS